MPGAIARLAGRALGAVLATVAVFLQGCSVAKDWPEDTQLNKVGSSTMQYCPGFNFEGSGFVAQAQAGEVVSITCPTDYVYDGPVIECAWVDRVCIAASPHDINPDFCWNKYNLTFRGHGLTMWPSDVQPTIVQQPAQQPPRDKSQLSVADTLGGVPQAAHHGHSERFLPALPAGVENSAGRRLADGRSHLLPTVIQPEQLVCRDEAFVDLDFERAEITHNNLGEKGPDKESPEGIYYRHITDVGDEKVDLILSTPDGDRLGNPERNGKGSAMGRVNLNSTSEVRMRFQFIYAKTKKPVIMQKVFFTLFDLGTDDHAKLEVTASNVSEYFLLEHSTLGVEGDHEPHEDSRCRYDISKVDSGKTDETDQDKQDGDNSDGEEDKKSVRDMWLESLNGSVVLVFKGHSEFSIVARTKPSPDGRDFEFSGWSEVAEMGEKTTCGVPDNMPMFVKKFHAEPAPFQEGHGVWWPPALASLMSLGMAAVAVSVVAVVRLARSTLSQTARYGVLEVVAA